jgi:hypothetical protein
MDASKSEGRFAEQGNLSRQEGAPFSTGGPGGRERVAEGTQLSSLLWENLQGPGAQLKIHSHP